MRPKLTPLQQAVVDAGRPLPQLRDPVEVELAVSQSVGAVAADEQLWESVVCHLLQVPSRRSQALLRALSRLLPGRPSLWAARAADELNATEPPWNLDNLTFGECWIGDRSVDAGYLALLCCYAYGDEPHAMVFLIDEINGSLVKNAFLTRNVVEAKQRLAEQVQLESITPQAAHWLLSRSYDRFERGSGPHVNPDVHSTRLVARRRIDLSLKA